MDKAEGDKHVQFDLEGQNNNNNRSSFDTSSKGDWSFDVLLETSGGADDSGHFTASPETDNSGSSRGHSPLTFQVFQECSLPPPSSAKLVQQACRRERRPVMEGDMIDSLHPPPSQGTNLNDPSVSVVMQESKTFNANNIRRSPVGILNKLTSQMPTSGEGDDGSHSSEYLRNVLDNFNALYKEKLRMIEDAGAQGDVYTKQIVMEKKASILECWAKDVCVQNIVLIHTVEELEKQADEKLTLLQKKIVESTGLAKQHVSVIQKYESQAKSLMKDKETSKEAQKELKRELDKLKSEYKRIRERINDLEKDNDSLVTLITRIRDMGVWDVAGLDLHKRTFEHLFGLYPNLPGSEVQTVFTREKARKIQENDEKVTQLEREVFELTSQKNESNLNLSTKESKLVELENEFKIVSNKLQHCQEECEHYKKSLIDTQEKLLEATKELQVRSSRTPRATTPNAADAARHAEIQELLQELRIVKTQLNSSVNESQSAKIETNMIRKEFNERLKSMHESQQSLQTELTHSFETHNQIQEKEAQLRKVSDEVRLYQTKCDAAETMLSKKDNMIEELQKEVQQLNKKELLMPSEVVNYKPTVSFANSPVLKCERDHLHNKGKCQVKTAQDMIGTGSKTRKVPWNDHFLKTSALDPMSILKSSKTSSTNNEMIKKEKISKNSVQSTDSIAAMFQLLQEKEKVPKLNNSPNLKTSNSFSLCSCGSQDILNKSIRSSEVKINNQKQMLGDCLPKIVDKYDLKAELQKLKNLKSQGVHEFKTLPQLPEIRPKKYKMNSSTFEAQKSNSFPKIENPFAHTSSYDLLMDIAVEASKKMLASANDTGPNNQVSSIRVVAGHSKRNQLKSRVSDIKMETRGPNLNQKQNQDNHKARKQTKHSGIVFSDPVNQLHLTEEPIAKLKFEDKEHKTNSKTSLSLENLLAELPEHSFMNVVQEWMDKSAHSNEFQSLKVPKSKTPSVQKSKNKISKQRRERNTNRQISGRSSASMMFTAKKKLVKDISDIKDEWNRVFENFDENISGNAAGDNCIEASPEDVIKDKSVTYGSQQNCTQKSAHSVTSEQHLQMSKPKATIVHTHAPPISTSDNSVVEKLKMEFAAEKVKMEAEFHKELKDKDIEITMQKVTIQHLQGALVALKRGQPLPIPQSSIGKPNGNGSVANCSKDLDDNVKSSTPLIGGNGLLELRESNEAGCESHDLWELMNGFEELKTTSLQQLKDLKNENNLITVKAMGMGKKILLFRHLMYIQDIRHNISSAQPTSKDRCITTPEDNISKGLAIELQLMKESCRSMTRQCSLETENVNQLTKVDNTLKNKMGEIQWQLERFKALAAELEAELVASKDEIAQLKRDNYVLKKKNSEVEEELWAAKIETMDLKNGNDSENDGYFSPLKRLEVMKKAFDKNEQIIQQQKQDIEDRNILIEKYSDHCRRHEISIDVKSDIVNATSRNHNCSTVPKELDEKLQEATSKPKSEDFDIHGLRNNYFGPNKKEDGFIDMESLKGHIDKLMEENENFMKQMPNRLQREVSSNLTSPLSDLTKESEKKQFSMDLMRGCGDVSNEIAVHYLEIERHSTSYPKPPKECHSADLAYLFEDLSRIAVSTERLGLISQDIISTTFNLFGMKPSNTENPQVVSPPFNASKLDCIK